MSYLRFASKVRPEVSMGGCVEQLRDPGFEDSTAISDPDEQYTNPWSNASSSMFSTAELSTENPRSGSKHVRFTQGSSSWNANAPGVAAEASSEPVGIIGGFRPIAATATPGQTFTASAWFAFVAQDGTLSAAEARISTQFLDASGVPLSPVTGGAISYDGLSDFGSGYVHVATTFTAPEGAAYIAARYGFQLFTPTVRLGTFTLDIDDASLCAL